jgi:hemerythrin-like metal-binding protein
MQQLIVDQHLELATLVGTVRKAHAAGATWEEMAAHFDEAIAKVSAHFEREELDMTLITYPHLVEHRTNHETFLRRLRLLRSECDRRESELMAVFMDMLENWLKNHERTADDLLLRYMAGHR